MVTPPISHSDAFAGDNDRGRDQQVPSLGTAPDGVSQPVRWLDRAAWQAAGFEAGRAGVDSDFGFFWGPSRRIPSRGFRSFRAGETVAARAGHMSFRAREVVNAAEEGSSEQLRKALAALSHREDRYMQRSESRHLIAALDGDLGSLGYMVVHSESLMALSRTAAKRAMGVDMVEVATTDGLHVLATAVDPGANYEVRILVPAAADATPRRLNPAAMADGRLWDYDTDTERATLTSSVVAATSAHEALRAAVSTELEIGGLGRRDARELITQVERAETLESARTGVGGVTAVTAQGVDAGPTRGLDRWAGLVSDLVDANVVHDPGWPSLAAALDRAHEAGWDVPANLPRLAHQTPLPRDPCAELQYRVMIACPQAIPTPSSTSHTDAPAAQSSGRARQEAELVVQHSPPPARHARAVGR